MIIADLDFDIDNNLIEFERNKQLRPAGCVLPYTKEHLQEIKHCYQDKHYFFENYCKVVTIDKGLDQITLRDYQNKALDIIEDNRFSIFMFPRQSGKTTTVILEILRVVLFKEHQNIAILANKEKTAKLILNRIKNVYSNLPHFLQQGIVSWSKTSIELENGSIITASATSSSAIRGDSINLIYIDEVATIQPNIWGEFYSSTYPTISSAETSKIILTSTPKGLNHWYKIWTDSVNNKNSYVSYMIDYTDVPMYQSEEWKRKTIEDIGERAFLSEFACQFIGSQNTLVHVKYLENMAYQDSLPFDDTLKNLITDNNHLNFLKIYEYPQKGHFYTIGADSSKLSENISGDALAISVLDVTDVKFKQVATYYTAESIMTYHDFPEIIYSLAKYYNDGIIFIENNEIGQEIADIIFIDFEYMNLYFEKDNLPGFRTTKKTKRLGASNLKNMIESEKLDIMDFITISQLSTFVKVKNSYKADVGKFDDAVMALFASLFILQIPDFRSDRSRVEFFQSVKESFNEEMELGHSFFIDPNQEIDVENILKNLDYPSYKYLK